MRQTTQHKYQIVTLIIVWAIVHGLLFWHFGIRTLFDSVNYVKWADYFLEEGMFEEVHHVFYAVPILLLASFRWLFPEQLLPFLIFQCLLSGVATLALYRSGSRAFNNTWAGFVSGILFLIWWDNIQWNIVMMTESLLCTFTCFVVYLLVNFEGRRFQYYFIIFLLSFIFFIRPTGIVIILGAITFLLRFHWTLLAAEPLKQFSIIALCLMIAFAGAFLMFAHWDFTDQYKRGNIVTYMDTLDGTDRYEGSLQLDTGGLKLASEELPAIQKMVYFIYNNPKHFFQAAVRKVWYLLTAIRPYYSKAHNYYLIGWMAFLYFLSFLGWRMLKASQISYFVISVVLANCILIAISTVDWDNRFYIPMEPGIVLLAGGGGVSAWNWIRKKMYRLQD